MFQEGTYEMRKGVDITGYVGIVEDVRVEPPGSTSDHNLVQVSIKIQIPTD